MTDNLTPDAESLAESINTMISVGYSTADVAKGLVDAGWVSPERFAAEMEKASDFVSVFSGSAAKQEARAEKAEAKVARVEALALPDGIWKGDKHVRLTRRDRTLGCDITESYVRVDDLTAALAEPERDEEGGND